MLNFGVWGNGTAHSYLRWRALPVRRKLDHVFYMAVGKIRRHKVLRAMRELLRHWQTEVEADGGVFHVVLTPERGFWFDAIWQDVGALSRGARGARPSQEGALSREAAREAPALDLLQCFKASVPDFRWGDWQFANDPHWTSAANMVAATCLYRHLERVVSRRLWSVRIDFAEVERARRRATMPLD